MQRAREAAGEDFHNGEVCVSLCVCVELCVCVLCSLVCFICVLCVCVSERESMLCVCFCVLFCGPVCVHFPAYAPFHSLAASYRIPHGCVRVFGSEEKRAKLGVDVACSMHKTKTLHILLNSSRKPCTSKFMRLFYAR